MIDTIILIIGGAMLGFTWLFLGFMIIYVLYSSIKSIFSSKYRKSLDEEHRENLIAQDVFKKFEKSLGKSPRSKANKEVLNAEKILIEYGKAIAKSDQEGHIIAKKKSLLPYSIGTIKQAYFIYVDVLIKEGLWTQEAENNLVTAYSALNSFVTDEKIIEIENLKKSNDINEKMKYMEEVSKIMHNGHLRDELYEYIIECHKKYGKQKPEYWTARL